MARRRSDSGNGGGDDGPHGDGFGDQGDLLASGRGSGGREADEASSESAGPESAGPESAGPESTGPEGDAPSRPEGDQTPSRPAASSKQDALEAELERADALAREGRPAAAVAAYKEIVGRRPNHVPARLGLGRVYERMGQLDRALEQLEAAREMAPEDVEALTRLGGALAAAGRFEDAERELRKAWKIDPESLEVRANMGILYFRRGLYAQAETELRWVCDRDEDHGPAHFYRGEALNRLGRVELAVSVLQRAAYLQPDNAKAYYTLGILFDKKNMPDEASRMYRRAREISRS